MVTAAGVAARREQTLQGELEVLCRGAAAAAAAAADAESARLQLEEQMAKAEEAERKLQQLQGCLVSLEHERQSERQAAASAAAAAAAAAAREASCSGEQADLQARVADLQTQVESLQAQLAVALVEGEGLRAERGKLLDQQLHSQAASEQHVQQLLADVERYQSEVSHARDAEGEAKGKLEVALKEQERLVQQSAAEGSALSEARTALELLHKESKVAQAEAERQVQGVEAKQKLAQQQLEAAWVEMGALKEQRYQLQQQAEKLEGRVGQEAAGRVAAEEAVGRLEAERDSLVVQLEEVGRVTPRRGLLDCRCIDVGWDDCAPNAGSMRHIKHGKRWRDVVRLSFIVPDKGRFIVTLLCLPG